MSIKNLEGLEISRGWLFPPKSLTDQHTILYSDISSFYRTKHKIIFIPKNVSSHNIWAFESIEDAELALEFIQKTIKSPQMKEIV